LRKGGAGPGTAGVSGTAGEDFLAGLNNDGTERRVGAGVGAEAGAGAARAGAASGAGRVVTKEEREKAGLPQKPSFEGVDDGGSRR